MFSPTSTLTPITIGSARERRARCTASDVLRWSGLPDWIDERSDARWLTLRQVPALSTLMAEGQPLNHLYVVVAGSFKLTRIDDEGYEQVLGFALQGDLLGLDALPDRHHDCGVVALEDGAVAALPLDDVMPGAAGIPALQFLALHAAALDLGRRAVTQYQMSAPSTEVRVARFLLDLGQRQRKLGHSATHLNLRMSRRDIASCLGVAHESISRALATLSQEGCIEVHARDIHILDALALQSLQRVTRGAPRSRALRHAQVHAEALAA